MTLKDFQSWIALLKQDRPREDREIVIIADGKLYEPTYIGSVLGKYFWIETKERENELPHY